MVAAAYPSLLRTAACSRAALNRLLCHAISSASEPGCLFVFTPRTRGEDTYSVQETLPGRRAGNPRSCDPSCLIRRSLHSRQSPRHCECRSMIAKLDPWTGTTVAGRSARRLNVSFGGSQGLSWTCSTQLSSQWSRSRPRRCVEPWLIAVFLRRSHELDELVPRPSC